MIAHLTEQRTFYAKRLQNIIEQFRGTLVPQEYNVCFETLALFHDMLMLGKVLELGDARRYVGKHLATVYKNKMQNWDFRNEVNKLIFELRNLPCPDPELHELAALLNVTNRTSGVPPDRDFPCSGERVQFPLLFHRKILEAKQQSLKKDTRKNARV